MMGHRMVETCPDRAVTPRDRQPWLHKCHRGLVPSKHHVDSSDSDRDSPFLDNRSPGSRGESNRIPPPSLLGRHSTGRTAPRLPPCVRTAAELAQPASHPIEGSAPFPTARFHRHRPCCDVPLSAAGASPANHTRQHREQARSPPHRPHRPTASPARANGCRAGATRLTPHRRQRPLPNRSFRSAPTVLRRPAQRRRRLAREPHQTAPRTGTLAAAPAAPPHGFPRACERLPSWRNSTHTP